MYSSLFAHCIFLPHLNNSIIPRLFTTNNHEQARDGESFPLIPLSWWSGVSCPHPYWEIGEKKVLFSTPSTSQYKIQ